MTRNIIHTDGFLSLYNGMSAALLRQGTYSTVRFAFYELFKEILIERSNRNKTVKVNELPFYQKMIIAGLGGGIGSIFGTPADVVNVR
jgi:solute carrier family 25 (mitochondrial dicarboxylate transporter), member 10